MIALDPNQTFQFTLPCQLTVRNAGGKATLRSRFPTARQLAEFDQLTEQANFKMVPPPEGDLQAQVETKRQLLLQALAITAVNFTPPTAPAAFVLDDDAVAPSTAAQFVLKDSSTQELDVFEEAFGAISAVGIMDKLPAVETLIGGMLLDGAAFLESVTLLQLSEIAGKALLFGRIRNASTLADLDLDTLWNAVNAFTENATLSELDRKKSALRSASTAAKNSALAAIGRPADAPAKPPTP